MKHLTIIIVILFEIGCSYKNPSVVTGREGLVLPAFDLLLMDSTTHLNTKKIPLGAPIVILFFSPVCPHCKAETRNIIKHIDDFRNVKFYFLSNAPFKMVKDYYDQFKLKDYENITVGLDYTTTFTNYYKTKSVPYTAFFDKEKRLKEVMIGKVTLEQFNQHIFN